VRENHPYNHGETSAIRDAGRRDFRLTTIFTTLSPCDICAALICMRQFNRVVVGDVTNASGNEQMLRDKGLRVDILEDQKGIALYAKYRSEKPDQDIGRSESLKELVKGHNSSCVHRLLGPGRKVWIAAYDYESVHGEVLKLKLIEDVGMVFFDRVVAQKELARDKDREL
jgi:tRNA(Arg) A34 adenosine deaminase TadA